MKGGLAQVHLSVEVILQAGERTINRGRKPRGRLRVSEQIEANGKGVKILAMSSE